MLRRTWLFGLLLAVPLVGVAVSQGIQAYENADLRAALEENVPDALPGVVANATVTALCTGPAAAELAEMCSQHANIVLLGTASIWAAGLGLALVALIRLAGGIARNDRRLLLWVFKPGLYVTGIAVIALVILHAAIAIAAIYFGEGALVGRVHTGIILAIGFGAVVGIVSLARHALQLVRAASTDVMGVRVGWKQAPELWEAVTALAKRLGAAAPQHIVLGLDPNFFVTEAEVRCLDGALKGRTLYCSLPLARILTRQEFLSIVGHELGHFRGEDTKFSHSFYPIYRGTSDSLAALERAGGSGSAMIPLLPAIAVFSYFLESFAVAENRISRERELEADRAGAAAAGNAVIATALVKVHAFADDWSQVVEGALAEVRRGQVYPNASRLYAELAASGATPERLRNLAETHLPHPTDSHPPLAERLASLGMSVDSVGAAALDVTPDDPAIGVIANAEAVETRVSAAFQQMLGEAVAAGGAAGMVEPVGTLAG